MAARCSNLKKVLDPWLEQESDAACRQAVLEALIHAAENWDELYAQPAAYGHPLKREIQVPTAGVVLVVLMANPFYSVHLLSIDPI